VAYDTPRLVTDGGRPSEGCEGGSAGLPVPAGMHLTICGSTQCGRYEGDNDIPARAT